MKNPFLLRMLTMVAATMIVATGCPEIDPDPEPEPEIDYTQLLSQYESLIDYKPWQVRPVSDENLTGPGGNFRYWWEHRTEANGAAELWAMYSLSDEQLATMSTRNLARTVYLYPYGFEFTAFKNEYNGILLEMGRFNGTRELMQRRSGATELLRLYTEVRYPHSGELSYYIPLDYTEYLDEGSFLPRIHYLTFLIITAIDYGCFTSDEVRILAGAVEEKIKDVLSDTYETYSWVGSVRFPYVLGAWTAFRYDLTLSDEQRNILRKFIDPMFNPSLYSTGVPLILDQEKNAWVLDTIMVSDASKIIIDSLARLKR